MSTASDEWDKDQRATHQPEKKQVLYDPKMFFLNHFVLNMLFKVTIELLLSKLFAIFHKFWLVSNSLICRYGPHTLGYAGINVIFKRLQDIWVYTK